MNIFSVVLPSKHMHVIPVTRRGCPQTPRCRKRQVACEGVPRGPLSECPCSLVRHQFVTWASTRSLVCAQFSHLQNGFQATPVAHRWLSPSRRSRSMCTGVDSDISPHCPYPRGAEREDKAICCLGNIYLFSSNLSLVSA